MWRDVLHMRFKPSSSLCALLVACSIVAGYGRQVAQTEPVMLHAANAAQAANVAKHAAKVAKRVAEHTEEVASDTAAALRYTRDALKQAGASAEEVAQVDNEAKKLEAEAGGHDNGGKRMVSSADSSSSAYGQKDSSAAGSGSASGSAQRITQDVQEISSESSGGSGVDRSLDVNSEIVEKPNGVEPFGSEEPAKVLTKDSVKQSDGMIHSIEKAQGVEAKRSVYRALTKLRGATIASYDGMARAHLKNVDNYNKKHKWREDHPIRHLAQEEDDTHIWAFPKKSSKKATKKATKKKPAGIAASPAPAAAPAAAA